MIIILNKGYAWAFCDSSDRAIGFHFNDFFSTIFTRFILRDRPNKIPIALEDFHQIWCGCNCLTLYLEAQLIPLQLYWRCVFISSLLTHLCFELINLLFSVRLHFTISFQLACIVHIPHTKPCWVIKLYFFLTIVNIDVLLCFSIQFNDRFFLAK